MHSKKPNVNKRNLQWSLQMQSEENQNGNKDWVLLHDYTPAWEEFLAAQCNVFRAATIFSSLYISRILSFPRMKSMKGKGPKDIDKMIVEEQLKKVSRNCFQECFKKLFEHWKNCVIPKETTYKNLKSKTFNEQSFLK